MQKKMCTGIVSICLISIIPFLLSKENTSKQTNMTRDTGKFGKLFGWSYSFILSLINFFLTSFRRGVGRGICFSPCISLKTTNLSPNARSQKGGRARCSEALRDLDIHSLLTSLFCKASHCSSASAVSNHCNAD